MTERRHQQIAVAALAVLALVLMSWRIGVEPLGDWDEALTGSRTLGLLETGDLFTVHLNGAPDFHKPPLYYALAAAATKVVGVGEAAMRLPGVAGAVAIAVLLFFIGRWIDGPVCGFFTALAYVTMPMFIGHGRQAQPDMVLYAASLGAMLAYLEAAFATCGLLIGLAVLTKGLAGVLAPLVIGCWWLLAFPPRSEARLAAVTLRALLVVGGVAAAVISPWLVWNMLRYTEGFEATFVGAEVTQRIVWTSPFGATGAYYASVARDTLGPALWVGFLGIPALVARVRGRGEWRRLALFPALAIAAVVALAITHPKNAHYVLVLALPVSVGVGLVASGIAQAAPPLAAAVIAMLWSATLIVGALRALHPVVADGRPNRDLQRLSAEIQKAVPPEAPLIVDRTAIQGVVFYSRRRVVKAPGFFFRAEPTPERAYGLLRSDVDSGMIGYSSRTLTSLHGLRLVELSRDPKQALPIAPRTMTRGDDPAMDDTFRLLGARPENLRKGAWVTHVLLDPRGADGRELAHDGWTLQASHPGKHASRAIDGSTSTVWEVAAAQQPGLAVTLDLGRTERVTRLVLETDDPRGFPRGLAVASATGTDDWSEIVRVGEFHPGFRLTKGGLDFGRDYAVEIRFAPHAARYLRLAITVGGSFSWRIAEFHAFAADDHG